MMNNYKKAIIKNETSDFLLGRGNYFVYNRDYGDHDITATYMDLLNYGKEVGEKKMYEQMNCDLFSILLNKENINIDEYTNLLGFVLFYFKYKFDYKKLKEDWEIPNQLRVVFLDCFYSLKKRYDVDNVIRINNVIKEKYNCVFLDI